MALLQLLQPSLSFVGEAIGRREKTMGWYQIAGPVYLISSGRFWVVTVIFSANKPLSGDFPMTSSIVRKDISRYFIQTIMIR